ncbi:MAG: exopolysaccharide transport family protein [Gemmataceae bacterium]
MANPDATNLPATGDARLPVPLNGTGERTVVPFEPSSLERIEAEAMQPAATEIASPLSMANLLKAFRHRWILAVSVALAVFALFASAAAYLVPAKYTAYALLEIAESEPEPLIPDQKHSSSASERYFENTQVALIKSRPILLAALRRPAVAELGIIRGHEDPAAWLEENLKVAFLEKTDILRISLDGTEPKELAVLVNAVKDAYMEEEVNEHRKKKLKDIDELDRIYLTSSEKIRNQRDALNDLAKKLQSNDVQALNIRQKAALEKYAALQRELTQLQAQIRLTEFELGYNKANNGQAKVAIPDSALADAVEIDYEIVQKKVQLMNLNSQISQLAKLTEPGHLKLQQLENDRKKLEQELDQIRARVRANQRKIIQDKMRGDQEFKEQEAKKRLDMYREQEKLLHSRVKDALAEAQNIGITAFELELKKSEFEQADEIIKRLREKKERLQVESQSSKQRVSVLHAAETPKKKNYLEKFRLVGFVGALGLLLGLFGVCYWEARNHRIMNGDEVVNLLGYRVVGEMPWVQGLAQGRQGPYGDPMTLLTESMADLRAMLLCENEGHGACRILMVASAIPREGKTTLSSHLAVSLAQSGRRTLLIDGDWRRPELHNVFDLPRGPGLCEVLRGAATVEGVMQPGPAPGLSIITAGADSHTTDSAHAMNDMRTLLETARQKFDFIIIDTPPILAVADALLLGKRADGVLLSVRPSVSQLPLVAAAVERLASLRIPILGAVVNGVPSRRGAYPYFSKYGYGLPNNTDPRPSESVQQ